MEVTRVIHPDTRWHEGLTLGWLPNKTGLGLARPYGCWFTRAAGSGVWMNVSRTKVAATREVLRLEWRTNQHNENNDAQICNKAKLHGFDTVQIMRRTGDVDAASFKVPEIVLCTGQCVLEESTSPCPGSPLHQSDSSLCDCDLQSPILRCKNSGTEHEDPCPVRRRREREAASPHL
eukprot:4868695-Prymnesium_polylepis.1